MLNRLHRENPDMGTDLAIDASDMPAYANGQRFLYNHGPERPFYSCLPPTNAIAGSSEPGRRRIPAARTIYEPVPSSFLSQARMRAMVRVYAGSHRPCLWGNARLTVSAGSTGALRIGFP